MRVMMRGVRNGEGLAYAPDGSLWTAVNERDEVPYPFHRAYGGQSEAFGKVIKSYVNEHPPDEVAKVIAGSTLGWPYCNPDPDDYPGEPEKGPALRESQVRARRGHQPGRTGPEVRRAEAPRPRSSRPLGAARA